VSGIALASYDNARLGQFCRAAIQYERASCAWPVLTGEASRGGTHTYKQLGERIGIHHRAVRLVLGVIQDYCLQEGLPPLTILVVNQGRQQFMGAGFIAWDVGWLGEGRDRVYEHPWEAGPNPFAFAAAGTALPSWPASFWQRPESQLPLYRRVRDRGMAQAIFRRALLDADGQCAFCGLSVRQALQAAHIIPWTEASDEQRMAVTNGWSERCHSSPGDTWIKAAGEYSRTTSP
jgi:putative restriction endonuclease